MIQSLKLVQKNKVGILEWFFFGKKLEKTSFLFKKLYLDLRRYKDKQNCIIRQLIE